MCHYVTLGKLKSRHKVYGTTKIFSSHRKSHNSKRMTQYVLRNILICMESRIKSWKLVSNLWDRRFSLKMINFSQYVELDFNENKNSFCVSLFVWYLRVKCFSFWTESVIHRWLIDRFISALLILRNKLHSNNPRGKSLRQCFFSSMSVFVSTFSVFSSELPFAIIFAIFVYAWEKICWSSPNCFFEFVE